MIFTKDAQNISQGDIYWAALNWYGEVLDVGWNRNPLDAARFTLLMQGYLPRFTSAKPSSSCKRC